MKKNILSLILFLVACNTEQTISPTATPDIPPPPPITTEAEDPQPTEDPQPVSETTQHPLAGLVYQASTGLWQIATDGSTIELAHDIPPKGMLSPDQTKVLFSESGDLYVYDIQTQTQEQLTNTPDVVERGYWWPNHQETIAYNFIPQDQLGPWAGYLGLFNISSDTMTVLDDEVGSSSMPALSPDGNRIAVPQNGQIMLYDVANGRWSPLDTTTFGLTNEQITLIQPAWSPDGTKLAVVSYEPDPNSGNTLISTIIFDFATQTHTRLHSYTPLGGGGWYPIVTWSATGDWLALRYFAEHENTHVSNWITQVDGAEKYLIADSGNVFWHPTEDQFLVERVDSNNVHTYTLANAEDGEETAVDIPTENADVTIEFITEWHEPNAN